MDLDNTFRVILKRRKAPLFFEQETSYKIKAVPLKKWMTETLPIFQQFQMSSENIQNELQHPDVNKWNHDDDVRLIRFNSAIRMFKESWDAGNSTDKKNKREKNLEVARSFLNLCDGLAMYDDNCKWSQSFTSLIFKADHELAQ